MPKNLFVVCWEFLPLEKLATAVAIEQKRTKDIPIIVNIKPENNSTVGDWAVSATIINVYAVTPM